MDAQIISIVLNILLGCLGGFTAILVGSKDWADLKTFAAFKRYILGAIIGGAYYLLHSDYGFPNLIMSFISAYSGADFFDKLAKRREKEGEQSNKRSREAG